MNLDDILSKGGQPTCILVTRDWGDTHRWAMCRISSKVKVSVSNVATVLGTKLDAGFEAFNNGRLF